MKIQQHKDAVALGRAAAAHGARELRAILARQPRANLIVATGASQFETLKHLVKEPGIDWTKVTVFHLDEYVGLPESHGASFRKYLRERFIDLLPAKPEFVPVDADAPDLAAELKRLNARLAACPIDLCLAGIGENSHLAFNDPPADFETEVPYIVVNLDQACRQQQFGEGWFPTFDDVPKQAVSMSIRQIMKSARIILSVPDRRKAAAVKGTVEGPVTPTCPASIVQRHADCTLYIDDAAAAELAR
ncbi:MAG: glucosamine-6-phosphate deaminase [Verrucomicrobia bacterium]|nr:glucosamine-6-phosphate deaminase [Verrucomicrobiota bacterium]